MSHIEINDLRNISHAAMDFDAGLNVLVGSNAQGKTSVLEAMALLARGRSFRTDDLPSLIRRGAPRLHARCQTAAPGTTTLEFELSPTSRTFRIEGRAATRAEYHGHLEVAVYSSDRLRLIRGSMRERRLFLDRNASVLWPGYTEAVRTYDRVLAQRNAALETGRQAMDVWDEQLIETGAQLRLRRCHYVNRLQSALTRVYRPRGEAVEIRLDGPPPGASAETQRAGLRQEMAARRPAEGRARRTLIGPHRDPVRLQINGEDAAAASSGQARSLLLALTLATLKVYHEERGTTPVALLDDLDSELDDERSEAVCREVARQGQALVTTAHPAWASRLSSHASIFHVRSGQIRRA